ENPANTGCRIHGDFSAPVVNEAGTTGDSPAAITRISSGVIAAVTRQPRASTTTAAGPAQPRGGTGGRAALPKGGPGGWVPPVGIAGGVWGGSFPPRQMSPTRRTKVTPAKP